MAAVSLSTTIGEEDGVYDVGVGEVGALIVDEADVGCDDGEVVALRAFSWAIRGAFLASLLASLICLSSAAILAASSLSTIAGETEDGETVEEEEEKEEADKGAVGAAACAGAIGMAVSAAGLMRKASEGTKAGGCPPPPPDFNTSAKLLLPTLLLLPTTLSDEPSGAGGERPTGGLAPEPGVEASLSFLLPLIW